MKRNLLFNLGARVLNLLRHQDQPSSLISSFQGNNEVAIWNIDKPQFRQKVFWPSIATPLSIREVQTTIKDVFFFFYFFQIFLLVRQSLCRSNVSLEK